MVFFRRGSKQQWISSKTLQNALPGKGGVMYRQLFLVFLLACVMTALAWVVYEKVKIGNRQDGGGENNPITESMLKDQAALDAERQKNPMPVYSQADLETQQRQLDAMQKKIQANTTDSVKGAAPPDRDSQQQQLDALRRAL